MPILIKSGGKMLLPVMSNPAVAGDIMPGKQAINANAQIITGTSTAKYLPSLTNVATATDIASGKQAISANGAKLIGNATIQKYKGWYVEVQADSKTKEIYVPVGKGGKIVAYGAVEQTGYNYTLHCGRTAYQIGGGTISQRPNSEGSNRLTLLTVAYSPSTYTQGTFTFNETTQKVSYFAKDAYGYGNPDAITLPTLKLYFTMEDI